MPKDKLSIAALSAAPVAAGYLADSNQAQDRPVSFLSFLENTQVSRNQRLKLAPLTREGATFTPVVFG